MGFSFQCLICIYLSFLISFGNCGDITFNYAPPSLRFGSADALHISDLDSLLATALGYTPDNLQWPGLAITSPFKYPSATVIFGIEDDGVSFKMEGTSYELKEDISLAESFNSLTSRVGARAQRPLHFQYINAYDFEKQPVASISETEFLDATKEIDRYFLEQASSLPSLVDYIDGQSSTAKEGQDIIFVDIDTYAPLVKEYGANSNQVKEASKILRSALVQAIDRVEKFYNGRVVVGSAMLSEEKQKLVRRIRDAQFSDVDDKEENHNLAPVYSDDFPVVFNIILILSIILIVAIIAISVSMAFMDPGRDSIIYRMTNPRMKKDQ